MADSYRNGSLSLVLESQRANDFPFFKKDELYEADFSNFEICE